MGKFGQRRAALVAAVIFAASATAPAFAQDDENAMTPGAIPNPGSYQSSMELQRQSDQQDQHFREQQQQPRYGQQPSAPPRNAQPQSAPRRQGDANTARPGVNAFGKMSAADNVAQAALDRGDWAEAIRLWRPLAERGDVNAEYNLGVMYDTGHGVAADETAAARWYALAADHGYSPAMGNLGVILLGRARAPADLIPAYKWTELALIHAQDAGMRASAQKNLSLLSAHMSRTAIARGHALATAWRVKQ